jgi:YfiH family protein
MDFIVPNWPAPPNVQARVTLREMGDMASEEGRDELGGLLLHEPVWLRQVHGTAVIDADSPPPSPTADAAFARKRGSVCAVMVADCMPVFFTDGTQVAVAHAGWRGLAAGVLEATLEKFDASNVICWLGPAIGPKTYEVGEDVRAAFSGDESAFTATRPGHWLLDLYAIARKRLDGVKGIYGGDFCTFSDRKRFFSFRRDKSKERMAALIWVTSA